MNEERRKQQILHILAAGIRKVMEEAHLDYGKLRRSGCEQISRF